MLRRLKETQKLYPHWLDKHEDSNFTKHLKVINEQNLDLYNSIRKLEYSKLLDKPIQIIKEQSELSKYDLTFKVNIKNLKKVSIYENPILNNTFFYEEDWKYDFEIKNEPIITEEFDDNNSYYYSYTHTVTDINNQYIIKVETYDDHVFMKGYPENDVKDYELEINHETVGDRDVLIFSAHMKDINTVNITREIRDKNNYIKGHYSSTDNKFYNLDGEEITPITDYYYIDLQNNNDYLYKYFNDTFNYLGVYTVKSLETNIKQRRYVKKGKNRFRFVYRLDVDEKIEDYNYHIEVTTYNNDTFNKSYPVSHNEINNIFDHDYSLDMIGAILNVPRHKYTPPVKESDLIKTLPPYNTKTTEDDYYYQERIKRYIAEYNHTYFPVLEVWKNYGVESTLVNRKVLITEQNIDNQSDYEFNYINCYVVNNIFYKDAEHTTEITPEENKYYYDTLSGIVYQYVPNLHDDGYLFKKTDLDINHETTVLEENILPNQINCYYYWEGNNSERNGYYPVGSTYEENKIDNDTVEVNKYYYLTEIIDVSDNVYDNNVDYGTLEQIEHVPTYIKEQLHKLLIWNVEEETFEKITYKINNSISYEEVDEIIIATDLFVKNSSRYDFNGSTNKKVEDYCLKQGTDEIYHETHFNTKVKSNECDKKTYYHIRTIDLDYKETNEDGFYLFKGSSNEYVTLNDFIKIDDPVIITYKNDQVVYKYTNPIIINVDYYDSKNLLLTSKKYSIEYSGEFSFDFDIPEATTYCNIKLIPNDMFEYSHLSLNRVVNYNNKDYMRTHTDYNSCVYDLFVDYDKIPSNLKLPTNDEFDIIFKRCFPVTKKGFLNVDVTPDEENPVLNLRSRLFVTISNNISKEYQKSPQDEVAYEYVIPVNQIDENTEYYLTVNVHPHISENYNIETFNVTFDYYNNNNELISSEEHNDINSKELFNYYIETQSPTNTNKIIIKLNSDTMFTYSDLEFVEKNKKNRVNYE